MKKRLFLTEFLSLIDLFKKTRGKNFELFSKVFVYDQSLKACSNSEQYH